MGILSNIEPKNVFGYFEDISQIPHGSGNTKAISDYLVKFAKNNNLKYICDRVNNVIIFKDGTKGYENSEPLIIQSHIDMVCEKELSNPIDMATEPIELVVNGDLISANGTTLGADDGIGVAYALAILGDNSIDHPPIEAVFTVDEEIGMLGAFQIDVSKLKGKRMLNLDCGNEKIFTVSCAGGITTKCIVPVKRADFSGDTLKIKISGLSGGHSGVMIGKGGANSNSLSGRLLKVLSDNCSIRLVSINGGFKDNAIPVETEFVIVTDNAEKCREIAKNIEAVFKNEYSGTDADLRISVCDYNYTMPLDEEATKRIIFMLHIAPNGVQKMSSHISGLVETSLNFAILNSFDSEIETVFSIRSSVNSQKDMMVNKISHLAGVVDAKVEISGDYPGWEYKTESEFRDIVSEVYVENFGFEPSMEAVHAGLECGLFSGMIPGLDALSYGPDMWDVHTPSERLSVSSTQRVWDFLKELLKRLK